MPFDNERYIDAFDYCDLLYKNYMHSNTTNDINDKQVFWRNVKKESNDSYVQKVCEHQIDTLLSFNRYSHRCR